METRIAQVGAMLRNNRIVEAGDGDTVGVGSVVTVAYDGDPDDVDTYLVGSIEERRDGLDVVSPSSPMGAAIIGANVGDTLTYESPAGGTLTVQIVCIDQ